MPRTFFFDCSSPSPDWKPEERKGKERGLFVSRGGIMSVGPQSAEQPQGQSLPLVRICSNRSGEGRRPLFEAPFLVGNIWVVVIGTNGLNCAQFIWFDSDSGHVHKRPNKFFLERILSCLQWRGLPSPHTFLPPPPPLFVSGAQLVTPVNLPRHRGK